MARYTVSSEGDLAYLFIVDSDRVQVASGLHYEKIEELVRLANLGWEVENRVEIMPFQTLPKGVLDA